MKKATLYALGAAAAAGGVLWLALRQRQAGQGGVQPAGLVMVPETGAGTPQPRYTPVPGAAATDPAAAARLEARRCLILFVDAYNRYHHHRLPYDLRQMQALRLRLIGPEFDRITRQDVWTHSDYDWLLEEAEVYFGPAGEAIRWMGGQYNAVYRLTDRRTGGIYQFPGRWGARWRNYTNWELPIRNLLHSLHEEARAGNTIPAARAVLLPFVTRAPESDSGSQPWHPAVPAMRAFWGQRGRGLAIVGAVAGFTGWEDPLPIWAVR